ncbi:hypothetical protein ACR03S_17415 (plasmid) [Limimaricola variabilis]|uniref:hypothetical protein n=1 Tax=Limimaricola variabilis TaxID=1492771 RepID=UPI002AC9D10D|nr:hypothetical protein [Limimaricola variabilis]WPY96657.1 hypothetical protein T8T21_19125 [Limimaricola variabilis]
MKYSADKNLFFVHVPKCAGLSIYRGLDPIADFPWAAFARDNGLSEAEMRARVTPFGYPHDRLGEIHQAHIPLPILARDFPRCFALLARSTSFAVLRDPRSRFVSALRQHLREFDGIGALSITDDMLRAAAIRVRDWLAHREVFADLRYIHFTRQSDYVMLDGRQVVDRLFAIEDLPRLEAWLHDSYGAPRFLAAPTNQSRQPKRWFRHAQPVVRALSRNVLPQPLRAALRPLWLRSGLYETASQGYDRLAFDAETEAFIAERYAQDARLHAAARRHPLSSAA